MIAFQSRPELGLMEFVPIFDSFQTEVPLLVFVLEPLPIARAMNPELRGWGSGVSPQGSPQCVLGCVTTRSAEGVVEGLGF